MYNKFLTSLLSKEEQRVFYQGAGELIKAARVSSGLSQEELSKLLGFISRVSIVNIESGKQNVQLHTLVEIAQIFKTPIQSLLPSYETIKKGISKKFLETFNKEVSKEISNNPETIEKLKDFVLKFQSKDFRNK